MSTAYIDQKYSYLVERELSLPKRTSASSLSARCPVCGDSSRFAYKRRFSIKINSDGGVCGCFNCGYGARFSTFLKEYFPDIYRQYRTEIFLERNNEKQQYKVESAKKTNSVLFAPNPTSIKSVRLVTEDNGAIEYLTSRKIDKKHWNKFIVVDNYREFLLRMNFIDPKVEEDKRIVMPLYNGTELLGFQGRSLDVSATIRYANNALDGKTLSYIPKELDTTKTTYVFEGVYDALIVDNSVAALSSNLMRVEDVVDSDRLVYAFDNERDNDILQKTMLKTVNAKRTVFIPNKQMTSKDINDLVVNDNWSTDDINNYMKSRTFTYPRSLLEYKGYIQGK
jgi:hypothetical protein